MMKFSTKVSITIIFTSFFYMKNVHATLCVIEEQIKQLRIGYVDNGQKHGPDGGDAILVEFENGQQLPADKAYNLDHSRGLALFSTLQTAFVLRKKVSLKDHSGYRCDDFQEVIIVED